MSMPEPKFRCGQNVYFKQSVEKDSGWTAVNGKEVARILQQDRYRICEVHIVETEPDKWEIYYAIRFPLTAQAFNVHEHEIVNAAEAAAILELIKRNGNKP